MGDCPLYRFRLIQRRSFLWFDRGPGQPFDLLDQVKDFKFVLLLPIRIQLSEHIIAFYCFLEPAKFNQNDGLLLPGPLKCGVGIEQAVVMPELFLEPPGSLLFFLLADTLPSLQEVLGYRLLLFWLDLQRLLLQVLIEVLQGGLDVFVKFFQLFLKLRHELLEVFLPLWFLVEGCTAMWTRPNILPDEPATRWTNEQLWSLFLLTDKLGLGCQSRLI